MQEQKKLGLVRLLLNNDKVLEAREIFQNIEPVNETEYYLLKGKIEQRLQNWGKAINAFTKVLEMAPENEEAMCNLQIIQNILDFWNPEMFNP